MVAIAIVTKSTTEEETATMTPVVVAEAQEEIIEAEAKAREVEAILIDKGAAVNLVLTETTGLQRVRAEAGDVAAITNESHATNTLVDYTVKVAHQTGFDIH